MGKLMAERGKMYSAFFVDRRLKNLVRLNGKKLAMHKIHKTPGSRVKFFYRWELQQVENHWEWSCVLYVINRPPLKLDFRKMVMIIIRSENTEIVTI